MNVFVFQYVHPGRRTYYVYGRTSPSVALQLLFLWVSQVTMSCQTEINKSILHYYKFVMRVNLTKRAIKIYGMLRGIERTIRGE